jgi:ATP-dependent protease ClpP protease subunit
MNSAKSFRETAAVLVMAASPVKALCHTRPWFKMEASGDDRAEITIYDTIGYDWWNDSGVTAKDFDRELKALGDVKEILLRINSPGGVVYEGQAIYNLLLNHPAKVIARVDGLSASAASLVMMAADEIEIPENAFVLIHEPSGVCMGMADDMEAVAADLRRMTDLFATIYAKRTGMSEDDVRALMKEDRLMTGAEAVDLGFGDRMLEAQKMAACFDQSALMALSDSVRAKVEEAMEIEADDAGTKPGDDADDAAGDDAGGDDEGREGDDTGDDANDVQDPPNDPATKPNDPASTTNVVKLSDVKAAKTPEDALGYAQQVIDLCTMAKKPELAGGYITARKTIPEVQKALADARADADRDSTIDKNRQAPTGRGTKPSGSSSWDKVIAKRFPKQVTKG